MSGNPFKRELERHGITLGAEDEPEAGSAADEG